MEYRKFPDLVPGIGVITNMRRNGQNDNLQSLAHSQEDSYKFSRFVVYHATMLGIATVVGGLTAYALLS